MPPNTAAQPTTTPADRAEDEAARVALNFLTDPGHRETWSLVQLIGAAATLDLALAGNAPAITSPARLAALGTDPRRLATAAIQQSRRVGARIVVPADDEWPTQLDALATLELAAPGRLNRDVRPPLCLWVRGDLPLRSTLEKSVAIVGARAATSYGVVMASDIAAGLADDGWTVVSGGAFGIDAAAHQAAVSVGKPTVAVLACGVDRPYPTGNATLFDRIAEIGLLISEWPPGQEPLRHHFLIRNRTVAAATQGTIMVEAATRSGAVQMIRRALVLQRTAMVVPGPATSAMSAGCHQLLRTDSRARLVTSISDVRQELTAAGEPDPRRTGATPPGRGHRTRRILHRPVLAEPEDGAGLPAKTAARLIEAGTARTWNGREAATA